jgi:hypothetical protein
MTDLDVNFSLPYTGDLSAYRYDTSFDDAYRESEEIREAIIAITDALDATVDRYEIDLNIPLATTTFDTDLSHSDVRRLINENPILSALDITVWGVPDLDPEPFIRVAPNGNTQRREHPPIISRVGWKFVPRDEYDQDVHSYDVETQKYAY